VALTTPDARYVPTGWADSPFHLDVFPAFPAVVTSGQVNGSTAALGGCAYGTPAGTFRRRRWIYPVFGTLARGASISEPYR
jgi:hypothetical protein